MAKIKKIRTFLHRWWLVVKNAPASAGALRDKDSIPASGRSPGGGHGNLLQYSCLKNPKSRGSQRVGHDCRDLARMHSARGNENWYSHFGKCLS